MAEMEEQLEKGEQEKKRKTFGETDHSELSSHPDLKTMMVMKEQKESLSWVEFNSEFGVLGIKWPPNLE